MNVDNISEESIDRIAPIVARMMIDFRDGDARKAAKHLIRVVAKELRPPEAAEIAQMLHAERNFTAALTQALYAADQTTLPKAVRDVMSWREIGADPSTRPDR